MVWNSTPTEKRCLGSNPTTSPSTPHFHISQNYRNAPVRACWVWVPDFRSSISVSDTTFGVRDGGIWFKPAGGYSAAAVEHIIAGVILLLAPHLRPPLPPGRMTFIGSRAVVCDRENHRCSWPHIPPFLSDSGECGMESPQGRVGWLTDLCALVCSNSKYGNVSWRQILYQWPTKTCMQICLLLLFCQRMITSWSSHKITQSPLLCKSLITTFNAMKYL